LAGLAWWVPRLVTAQTVSRVCRLSLPWRRRWMRKTSRASGKAIPPGFAAMATALSGIPCGHAQPRRLWGLDPESWTWAMRLEPGPAADDAGHRRGTRPGVRRRDPAAGSARRRVGPDAASGARPGQVPPPARPPPSSGRRTARSTPK
jgi:hypothetical protein